MSDIWYKKKNDQYDVSLSNGDFLCNDCWWGCIEYLCCVKIYNQYFSNPTGIGPITGLCDKCLGKIKTNIKDGKEKQLQVTDTYIHPTTKVAHDESFSHMLISYMGYEDCVIQQTDNDIYITISFGKLIGTALYKKAELLINTLWKSLPPCIATECAWNHLNNCRYWQFKDEPKPKPHNCRDFFNLPLSNDLDEGK